MNHLIVRHIIAASLLLATTVQAEDVIDRDRFRVWNSCARMDVTVEVSNEVDLR